jgi:hypothetical protein
MQQGRFSDAGEADQNDARADVRDREAHSEKKRPRTGPFLRLLTNPWL